MLSACGSVSSLIETIEEQIENLRDGGGQTDGSGGGGSTDGSGGGGSTDGSGGQDPGDTPVTSDLQTFDTLAGYSGYADEIIADIGDSPFDDPAALPASGSSRYVGVLEIGDDIAQLASGAMTLNVNFGTDSVTGSVTDWVDFEDEPMSGQLAISAGDIDRGADVQNEFTFSADLGGTLTTVLDEQIGVDAVIFGDFFQNQTLVAGGAQGEYLLNGQSFPMTGLFFGEE